MARLLLLSNGHGEDLSGALLGQALQRCGHQVDALPLVGSGHPYRDVGIPVVLNTREFSTGGLGYTSLQGRLTELIQGQVFHLLAGLLRLTRLRRRYSLIVAIGDVIPVMAAWISGRPVATYLVAYSSHYEGRLNLPWPCAPCLRSRRFRAVFSRDKLSADDLSLQLGRKVQFAGNPFMAPVLTPAPPLPPIDSRLALLPGSRRPELERNLRLLLTVIERLPAQGFNDGTLGVDLALIRALGDAAGHAAAGGRGHLAAGLREHEGAGGGCDGGRHPAPDHDPAAGARRHDGVARVRRLCARRPRLRRRQPSRHCREGRHPARRSAPERGRE